jgi:hypothetical protein
MKRRLSTWTHHAIDQLVSVELFDAALGDLAEEYASRAQGTSSRRASRWYWGQLARSMPRMMWIDIRRSGSVATIAVAFGAWLVAGLVESIADVALIALYGSDGVVQGLPGVIVGLAAFALSGYLTALVRPAATKVLAAMTALVVAGLMVVGAGSAPLWYGVAFLVFGPMMSIAGGAWRKALS